MPQPILLVTRPEAAARRFAAEVAGLGLPVVIAPLMRIVPVPHDSARLHAAPVIVLTSASAVPAAGPGAGRLALCVGEATAAEARRAGFAVQVGATSEASGLLPLIEASEIPPLHARGSHVAAVLPVEAMIVYDQQPVPLSDAGRAILAGYNPVILPLFSPRSARLASDACMDARAPLIPLAISVAAAREWQAGGAPIRVAARPDGPSMHALLVEILAEQK